MSEGKGDQSAPDSKPASPLRRRLLQFAGLAAASAFLHIKPGQADAAETETKEDDIIPREELDKKYHIKILDLPRSKFPDFVELNFRRSAITEHPLFEKKAKESNNLYIVILNGPYLSSEFLTEDQRKALPEEAVRKLDSVMAGFVMGVETEIKKNKKIKLGQYYSKLAELQGELASERISQDYFNDLKAELDFRNSLYIQEQTPESLMERARGVTIQPSTDRTEHQYIFLPGRDIKSGNAKLSSNHRGTPVPSQSYLDPKTFFVNPDEKEYPIIEGNTPSSNLIHEMEHLLGVQHPYADLNVVSRYESSSKRYKEGDDKGYIVKWETPEGEIVSKQNTTQAG